MDKTLCVPLTRSSIGENYRPRGQSRQNTYNSLRNEILEMVRLVVCFSLWIVVSCKQFYSAHVTGFFCFALFHVVESQTTCIKLNKTILKKYVR